MTGEQLKEQIMAFAPLLISVVLLINTFLSAKGLPCIGLSNEEITTVVSGIASAAAVLWTWWKNNNVTPNAQVSQEVLNSLNSGKVTEEEVKEFLNGEAEVPETEEDIKEEVKKAVDRSEELDG